MYIVKQRNIKGEIASTVSLHGKVLPLEETKVLAADARYILKTSLWGKLTAEVRSRATDRLVNKSLVIDDMVYAKAMLYTLDVLEEKVREISNL